MHRPLLLLLAFAFLANLHAHAADEAVVSQPPRLPLEHHLTLAPQPGNPRNSEGDFIQLKDGRWLFIYTHFVGGADDHARAFLASRESADGGRTWTGKDNVVVQNEGGFNVMSVSLLRLKSGEIALFYVRKNSLQDCRPVLRLSRDEAKTWSAPRECITNDIGYYVLNNSRVLQLENGRLIMPTSLHPFVDRKLQSGKITTFLSDDAGQSWHRSGIAIEKDDHGLPISFMEPGVVEATPAKLLMIIRTKLGCQYLSESTDHGETWRPATPSDLLSPESPATLVKIPSTGDLLLIWNDHTGKPEAFRRASPPVRNPLVAAISSDGGKTWTKKKLLENEPGHGYCYTAVAFAGDHVLLAHCAHKSPWGLETIQISSFLLRDLYQ